MVQIWNDGSLPVQTYRLSSSGEEIKHASPISKGAAIVAEGCAKTIWRARLDQGRLVDEFTQGSSSTQAAETTAVSISASSLTEDVASERWRIQDCQPQPQFPVRARFSELRDVGASFDLQLTRGGLRSRTEVSSADKVPGPEIFADVTLDLLEDLLCLDNCQ